MAGLLDYLFGRDDSEQKSAGARPYNEVLQDIADEQAEAAGEHVSHHDALGASAVLCVARVIADGLAQVPFKLLRPAANGGRGEDAVDHPVYRLLRYEPNDWQTSYEFREQVAFHVVLTGNAFVYINRDGQGRPQELYAFEPGSVTVTRKDDYSLSYRIVTGKRKTVDFIDVPQKDIWHIKGPSWNGWLGMDMVKQARKAIGLSLASEKFGASLFKNGARPGGILSTDQNLTAEQRAELRAAWQVQQSGTKNAHKTAVLGNGMKFSAISSTADEAQWTESRKFQINEICRAFRVQPIMVMQSDGATSYNSVEQLLLSHLVHTLMPWYERFEQSAYKSLLNNKDKAAGLYFKLDSRALLEAATADRLNYYKEGRASGWLSINEVREKEDLARSDDPKADELTPAQNLFGKPTNPSTDDEV